MARTVDQARTRLLRMHTRGIAVGVATAFVALAPAVAWAAPPGPDALPITVVTVKTDDAFDQAEALTLALQKVVRDSDGWSLAEGEHSLEFLAVKMGCQEPIDAECEARIAEVIKADRYIWTTIQMEGDQVTGKVHMFVRGKGTSAVDLKYSQNLTEAQDDALLKVARDALASVTGGRPKGGVRVKAGIAGQIFIDDVAIGALPAEGAEFQLEAGVPHRIVVKAPGKNDAESTVTVKPAVTVDLPLTMVDAPKETSIDGRMIGGFVSLGAGVVAGAVGLWAALDVNAIRSDENFDAYRAQFPPNVNACDQARDGFRGTGIGAVDPATVADLCDRADSRELIQAVTFPVAAVAVGVGAFLLGTSSLAGDDEEETVEAASVTIEPVLGLDVQALNLRYRFE